MPTRQTALLIGGAFLLYAIWQMVEHIWLPGFPSHLYHAISLVVGVGLVLFIAVVALTTTRGQQAAGVEAARSEAVLASLSEQVRPSLVALLGDLRALTQSPTESLDESTHALLQQALEEGGELLRAVEGLIAATEGKALLLPHAAPLSAADLARAALDAYRVAAERKQVVLELEAAPELPPLSLAPGTALQLVSALIGNALEVSPPGGRVHLQVSAENGGIAFVVGDGGPSLLDRPAPLCDVACSAGVHYCHHLAEALGGTTRYEPVPGGNAISVHLPASSLPRSSGRPMPAG